MRSCGIILLGAAIGAIAQIAPVSVCMSWSTVAATPAARSVPSCGFHGWDKGTNIGYYVGGQYGSLAACSAICDSQSSCLSFTYLASNLVCIIYDYAVEGNMTPDSNSPFVFFDQGGVCPSTVAASTGTSSARPIASSSPAVVATPSPTRSSRTSTAPATSPTTPPSTLATSTTPSVTKYTTLFSSTTTYSTSYYTTSTCNNAAIFCLGYSTFTTYAIEPVSTSVAYTTKAV